MTEVINLSTDAAGLSTGITGVVLPQGALGKEAFSSPYNRLFPEHLSEAYKNLWKLPFIKQRNLGSSQEEITENLAEFERLVNSALPRNDAEWLQHSQEYLHYVKDPAGYCTHLNKSHLRFLILWTDNRTILRHFGVGRIIHMRWHPDVRKYTCEQYRQPVVSNKN
jgi:hypothetical protein